MTSLVQIQRDLPVIINTSLASKRSRIHVNRHQVAAAESEVDGSQMMMQSSKSERKRVAKAKRKFEEMYREALRNLLKTHDQEHDLQRPKPEIRGEETNEEVFDEDWGSRPILKTEAMLNFLELQFNDGEATSFHTLFENCDNKLSREECVKKFWQQKTRYGALVFLIHDVWYIIHDAKSIEEFEDSVNEKMIKFQEHSAFEFKVFQQIQQYWHEFLFWAIERLQNQTIHDLPPTTFYIFFGFLLKSCVTTEIPLLGIFEDFFYFQDDTFDALIDFLADNHTHHLNNLEHYAFWFSSVIHTYQQPHKHGSRTITNNLYQLYRLKLAHLLHEAEVHLLHQDKDAQSTFQTAEKIEKIKLKFEIKPTEIEVFSNGDDHNLRNTLDEMFKKLKMLKIRTFSLDDEEKFFGIFNVEPLSE
jgi:hypothetical protein